MLVGYAFCIDENYHKPSTFDTRFWFVILEIPVYKVDVSVASGDNVIVGPACHRCYQISSRFIMDNCLCDVHNTGKYIFEMLR